MSSSRLPPTPARRRALVPASRPLSLVGLVLLVLATLLMPVEKALAMKIQTVKSPGGIEAWLVEERSVPLIALRFAFEGGNVQDPVGKEGLANFLTGMMDEGAGDLTSTRFQERMEEIAMRMSFDDGRDTIYGSLESLTVNRDAAVALLKMALTTPRFDADAVERVRKQLLAGLAAAARNPDRVATTHWGRTAFGDHPYGRPSEGTPESIASITREDLVQYHKRIFARGTLKVVAVGDIDPPSLGTLLDTVFADLPAKADLAKVMPVAPPAKGKLEVVDLDVPQSVAVFGHAGLLRKDPDFITATVVTHILGGGGFASRLMEEVREKRGLAYGVYAYLQPYRQSGIFAGSVATKNEAIAQSLDVIKAELKRMATEGPTPTELENAKSYMVGSYALRFDTNSKIANQLLGIREEDLGLDYVEKRNDLIKAVTMEEAKRVAKRLLDTDGLLVTVVGKPVGLPGRS